MGTVPGFGRPGRNGPAPQQQSVAGIDRGLKANLDPNRGRPRKTVDPAALFVNVVEDGPFIRDYRDVVHLQPHAMYTKDVSAPALLLSFLNIFLIMTKSCRCCHRLQVQTTRPLCTVHGTGTPA